MCVGIEQKVEAFGNIPILGSAWLTGPAATSPAGSWLISDVISSFFQLTTVKTDSSPALLFECEFSLPLYCKKRKEKKKKTDQFTKRAVLFLPALACCRWLGR